MLCYPDIRGLHNMGWTRSSYSVRQNNSSAPHYEKLLIIVFMSLYTPSTYTCFVGCEVHGLHEWATTLFPATEQYTWATRGELYFITYLHTISRGELYGLQIELTGDLFNVCKTTTQRPKGRITFHSTLIRLRLSDLNPTIDHLPGRAVLLFSAN